MVTAALLATASVGYSQTAAPAPLVSLQTKDQELPAVLRELERQTHYTFVYSEAQVQGRRVPTLKLTQAPLEQALQQLLHPVGLNYRIVGPQIVLQLFSSRPVPTPTPSPTTRSAPPATAFGRTLRGRIMALSTGLALPGASVLVKGTTRGAIASADGEFTLPLTSTDSVLVVNSLGFIGQEVRVAPLRQAIAVVLREDARTLAEVVVTGFGLARERKSLGYSVQDLPAGQIVESREPNFINSVSGKLAGVQVSRSGSGPMGSTNIIIRGYTSLTRDSRPLVVVDGVPIDNRNPLQATRYGGYDSGDGLSAINPEDVASLSVLKGGNAAALYGNRAANGVLIITTKKGQPGLHLSVSSTTTFDRAHLLTNYQNQYGQGTQGRFLDDAAGKLILTPEGFPQVEEALESVGSWGPRMQGQLVRHWTGQLKPFSAQPTNVQDFFQLGYTTANTVALATGTERSTLRVSVADLRNRGTYPNSRLARNFATVRATRQFTSRLSVDVKASYIYSRNFNRPTLGSNSDNVMTQFQHLPRSVDLDDLRSYRDPLTLRPVLWNQNRDAGFRNTMRQNPFWTAYLNTNQANQHRANGFAAVRYDITDRLWLQLRAGTDFYVSDVGYRYASYTSWNNTAVPDRGGVAESRLHMREHNFDFIASGSRQLGQRWSLTGQAFGSLLQKRNETTGVTGQGLLRPNVFTLANAASKSPVYSFSRFEVQSVFSRAQLAYREAVFLEVTGRNDWDSTLPRGSWSYFYPSASLAASYTELLGWKSRFLTLGKLRASWTRVGKGAGPYELTTQYDLGSGVPEAPGVGSSHLGQPFANLQDQLAVLHLKPQITRSVEVGSEMRFGRNRATLDITAYRSNTFNQVTSVLISATSGFRTQLLNAGNIQNQGLEVVASAAPLRPGQRLQWELTLNWAANRSKVVRLAEDNPLYQLGAESNNVAIVAQAGRPFGDIVGTQLQRTPDGRLLVGPDGLPLPPGQTTARLGNFQPRWFGGFFNRFSYGNLSLSVLLDARWGGQIYSVSQQQAALFGNTRATLAGRAGWYASEAAREAAGISPQEWIPTGGLLVEGAVRNPDNTYTPSRRYVNPQAYWARLSTFSEPFVYDATFVKLREVTLTYRLPAAFITRIGRLQGASFSIIGRNLGFLKRATQGFDPESAYNLSRAQGLESGGYPNSQTVGYYLTLEF
ncbi:TonB-linked SusC/RagA family outer membrane protein [Hymenobacter luteus]|uniref:TonB-linked SusC/RagA family outer membrane protein n=2 Tax=Hymenobacter TaxID=89966 RepID=A0A7W9T571_9BACT|nr:MULTISPECIES: SusC/RagA family TonB-linked outer membrane protein [Hymenobacter]MBB4603393.1 TonB-linked SusC/RagA family outer membrane protein [Hymenobacter latericoloratus]MBB6061049.1 TonB-linked SusC/RagA family outer membrane protein [Hymenobacter luteus]